MAPQTISARRRQQRISRGEKALAPHIARWLQLAAKYFAKREMSRFGKVSLKKASKDKELRKRLETILRVWGMRQAQSAANAAGGTTVELPASFEEDLVADVENDVKLIYADTSREATVSVNRVIKDALREKPTPSRGEVARRIRTQFHGSDEGQGIHTFSPERAAVIARTEMGRAESIGQDAGYRAVGVWGYEWIAYTDGRSGKRRHDKMHGKVAELGAKFSLPSGAKVSYPRAPETPPGDAINCRCDFKALLRKPT